MEYMRGYQIYALRASTLTITGTLPQGSTSLSLHNGHNLIGVSVINDGKTPPEAFNGIPYTVIKTLDASGHLQPVSDTTPLEKGKSYYITVTADSTYSETTLFGQTTFVYDGDGGRIKRVTPDDTTIFVGSLYDIQTTASGVKYTKHIFLGDTRICSLTKNEAAVVTDTCYYHGDHLGSTSDITDASGILKQHTEYLPYGETYIQEGEQKTEYLYTGKLLDSSTGLYYYGARYYDPEIARFTQADTIVPNPSNPQDLNRYSYCSNNPINYTDPTGHSWKRFWEKITNAFIAEVLVIAIAFVIGGPQAAFSVSTLIAATAAAGATLTLDTGEGRQLQKRVAKEVFDDALGMSPGVAQTFSSITLHMAVTMGYNAALNAMIFNPNLQTKVDQGQSDTGTEGRSESASKEVSDTNRANNIAPPETGTNVSTSSGSTLNTATKSANESLPDASKPYVRGKSTGNKSPRPTSKGSPKPGAVNVDKAPKPRPTPWPGQVNGHPGEIDDIINSKENGVRSQRDRS